MPGTAYSRREGRRLVHRHHGKVVELVDPVEEAGAGEHVLGRGTGVRAQDPAAVAPESPAAVAGFEPGDVIVAIDGRQIQSFSNVQRIVASAAGTPLSFTVERDGAELVLEATPATLPARAQGRATPLALRAPESSACTAWTSSLTFRVSVPSDTS